MDLGLLRFIQNLDFEGHRIDEATVPVSNLPSMAAQILSPYSDRDV